MLVKSMLAASVLIGTPMWELRLLGMGRNREAAVLVFAEATYSPVLVGANLICSLVEEVAMPWSPTRPLDVFNKAACERARAVSILVEEPNSLGLRDLLRLHDLLPNLEDLSIAKGTSCLTKSVRFLICELSLSPGEEQPSWLE